MTSYTARAAEKLRRQQSQASALQVFLQTNPHKEGEPQYHPGIVVKLLEPTDDTRWLASLAMRGLEKIYKPGYRYEAVKEFPRAHCHAGAGACPEQKAPKAGWPSTFITLVKL